MRSRWSAVVAILSVAAAVSCAPSAPAPDLGPELSDRVTVDGVYNHLVELQKIADAHDDNRADGSPGYQASVDYVAQLLRDRGFDVQTPEFQRLSGSRGGEPVLTVVPLAELRARAPAAAEAVAAKPPSAVAITKA
ncbi:MAG: peptidase M28, partial [Mycobacterium sp.]|nr:peptidase M28 [Mycobacterium sp.]